MRKRTIRYTEGEIGRIGPVMKDFLPPPDQLVFREPNVKVTLSLGRKSVDSFKREAKKQRVPYQRMIRAPVDAYAERQGAKADQRKRQKAASTSSSLGNSPRLACASPLSTADRCA